jgi:hypothetical protein
MPAELIGGLRDANLCQCSYSSSSGKNTSLYAETWHPEALGESIVRETQSTSLNGGHVST